ncbi:tRNA adenosine deaminase-associated protein [Propionibacteriaceae bacterium G57]|uniref:tRNA adenosine deaminase-associated protein n=1 Tax=Aestuariimicrobium sp. G57 TaxID=3418485 RepID=UPI003DA78D6A
MAGWTLLAALKEDVMTGEDVEHLDAREARGEHDHLIDEDIVAFDDVDDDFDEDDVDSDDAEDDDDSDDDDDDDSDDDDDDSDDDSEDDEDDEDDDFIEDATEEDIDLVVAAYREDGEPIVQSLNHELANDLDELINQLRRLPGDTGAIGAVSIAGDFFVLVRVRGHNVGVLLSDSVAAQDWPIARDVADFLGVDPPEDDDDSEALGDLDIFADLGISEMDMESLADETDEVDADEAVAELFDRLKFGVQFKRALATDRSIR